MENDARERLLHEYRALRIRVHKLEKFVQSMQFRELPDMEQQDLCEQLNWMQGYRRVLSRRVRRAEDGTTGMA